MKEKGTFEFTPPTNEEILQLCDAEYAFERLEAQAWIDDIRVENNDGSLDIDATARRIGVPVYRKMPVIDGKKIHAAACIEGLGEDYGLKPISIYLNPDHRENEHDVSYGHELGHLFLETEMGIRQGRDEDNITERFCEFFGRQMALPLDQLSDIRGVKAESIPGLIEHFNTTHMTLIYQLMLAGKMPRRIFLDTSRGERPNPFYSNRIRRHCICLDCEIGIVHYEAEEQAPVYDLTAFKWSDTMSGYCRTDQNDMDRFIAVNKLYGRWTEENENLLSEQIAKEAETDATLSDLPCAKR